MPRFSNHIISSKNNQRSKSDQDNFEFTESNDFRLEQNTTLKRVNTKVINKYPRRRPLAKPATATSIVGSKKSSNARLWTSPSNVTKNSSSSPKRTSPRQRVFPKRNNINKSVESKDKVSPLKLSPSSKSPYKTKNLTQLTEHTKSIRMFQDPYTCHYQMLKKSPPFLPISVQSRAVAIDTRTLPDFLGDASSISYLSTCLNFLRMSARRGVLPFILSTSFKATSTGAIYGDNSRISARAICLRERLITGLWKCECGKYNDQSEREQMVWKNLLNPVVLAKEEQRNFSSSKQSKGERAKNLPRDSWIHFADMIDSIVQEGSKNNRPQDEETNNLVHIPLNATVFACDAIFFSENDRGAHKIGLEHFWDRVQANFESRRLSSINIVVLETDAHLLNPGIKCTQTFHFLQQHLKHLCHKKSFQDVGPNSQSITITLQMIQNHPIISSSIIRSWIRQAMPTPHIILPFPELMEDSSQCTVSLVLEYTLLPSSVNSSSTWNMIQHCKTMESSRWEMVLIMDMSDVNASLIYGIPMIAKAGMKENHDLDAYKEMQNLVQQLWRYLNKKDIVLLLRSIGEKCHEGGGSCGQEDHYILMVEAQKIEDLSERTVYHGVLFHYALNEQMLWDMECDGDYGLIHSNEEDENQRRDIEQQYDEFIEQSLDLLERNGHNPILCTNNKSFRGDLFEEQRGVQEKTNMHDVTPPRIRLINEDRKKWENMNGITISSPNHIQKNCEDTECNDFDQGAFEIYDYT